MQRHHALAIVVLVLIGTVLSCTTVLGIDTEHTDNPCDTLEQKMQLCGVGACQHFEPACVDGLPHECPPAATVMSEECDGVDNNCDGIVDEGCPCTTGATQGCYRGSPLTRDVGLCRDGKQKCENSAWGPCQDDVLPTFEACGDGRDNDCDGVIENGCKCKNGEQQECFGRSEVARSHSPCKVGTQTCQNNVWGDCANDVLPSLEVCNDVDDDCDGKINEDLADCQCNSGDEQDCYDPSVTPEQQGKGQCQKGTRTCVGNAWGKCVDAGKPSIEVCDQIDNDCNDVVDDNLVGAICCINNRKDGAETDVDCGSVCPPSFKCAEDKVCNQGADCQSQICGVTGVCQAPKCNDHIKNGTETDIDCGGICGNNAPDLRCDDGKSCNVKSDCMSDICSPAGICIGAGCMDNVKNGTETGTDCGGGACPKCSDGVTCLLGTDCINGICDPILKQCKAASCNDLVKNGVETDTDCGGGCNPCNDGQSCTVGRDCKSKVCVGDECQAARCPDGVQNGTETDVDCGGLGCDKCDLNENCSANSDCKSDVCQGGKCSKKPNGLPCNASGECQSDYCVDGLCCERACAGKCEFCSTGGFCVPVPAGTKSPSDCGEQSPATCGQTGACDGFKNCQLYPGGTTCAPAQCIGQSGISSSSTCNGDGSCVANESDDCDAYVCVPNVNGAQCATSCVGQPANCVDTAYCNGVICQHKKDDGRPCADAKECKSGNCTDNVCCNLPCNGECQACSATKKGSGADGQCASISAGTDPDNECSRDSASTCGKTGECNGTGACALYPGGTQCAPASCSGTTLTEAKYCDGGGLCIDNGTQSCGAYLCNGGMCPTTCQNSSRCANGYYCSTATSECVAKKDLGARCANLVECNSGNCIDGVCCNSDCSGACKACNLLGAEGTCTNLGANQADPLCQPISTCGFTGLCNGNGGCSYGALNTLCGAASCNGNTLTPASRCDGQGTCAVSTNQSCGLYACNSAAGQCNAPPCATDANCSSGAYCMMSACVAKKPTGDMCNQDSACLSGNCVDNYCCNEACSGTCKACNVAGNLGTCTNVPSGQADSYPVNTCIAPDACNGSGVCKKGQGGTCATSADCANNLCVDGRCCNSTCNATCMACNVAGSEGTCSNIPAGQDDNSATTTCNGTNSCNGGSGATACKKDVGQTCSANADCANGTCVDGYCCDSACTTTCQACNVAGSLGTCTNIPAGDDDNSATATCTGINSCNGGSGTAACKRDLGQTCSVATDCVNGTCVDGYCCNSACTTTCQACNVASHLGTCWDIPAGQDDNSATATCTGINSCNGSSGTAACKRDLGQTCSANNECVNGTCVDGYCCNSACTTSCQACNVPGNLGTCTNIPAGQDDNSATTTCTGINSCNGSSGTAACKKDVGQTCNADTDCANSPCVDGYCCNSACTATCQACNVAGHLGTCWDIPAGQEDTVPAGTCAGINSCNGSGSCLMDNGRTCEDNAECTSGKCIDGRCCDSDCTTRCQACNVAGHLGTCWNVPVGEPDDPTCPAADNMACDGSGRCYPH